MPVARYNSCDVYWDEEGRFMLYDDHKAIVEELAARIDELKQEVENAFVEGYGCGANNASCQG